MSQAEIAAILNKPQEEVSKIERRQDVLVSTLREYVKSLGGTLQVIARLPKGIIRHIEFEGDEPVVRGRSATSRR